MDACFFHSDSSRLFGLHHQPRTTTDYACGVVICAPIGHEYLRTHWALRLIANQLARKGCHVLRFDYRGLGDSSGDPQDVMSLGEWSADIESGVDYLKARSNIDSVMLLGLRTGAALAAEVASRRSDVHSIVAWEPVISGAEYLKGLRDMHQTMIDFWYEKVSTINDHSHEELLGFRYRRELLNEIERWNIDFVALEIPQVFVEPADASSMMRTKCPSWQKRLEVSDEDSWGKLSELEAAWLRPKTSQQIVQTITNLFERLHEREMLVGAAR